MPNINFWVLRFYIIFDRDLVTSTAIMNGFAFFGDFQCSAVVDTPVFQAHKILEFQPELVIINLDNFRSEYLEIVEKLNRATGVLPKYIGITSCTTMGFKAFKNGFMDIIDEPKNPRKILEILRNYRRAHLPNKFYCISYYHDFQYISMDSILLIKADGYTSEFIMKDGSVLVNFKTLKHSHEQLPQNFQRIHKSFVINSFYVRRIHIGRGEIFLRNWHQPVPISKTYLRNIDTVKRLLTSFKMPLP